MALYNYPTLPSKLLSGDIIRITPPNIAELRLEQFGVKEIIAVLRGGNGANGAGFGGGGSKFAVQMPILPTTLISLTPGGNANGMIGGFSGGGNGSASFQSGGALDGGGGGGCAILKIDGALACVAAGGGGGARAFYDQNNQHRGTGGNAPGGNGHCWIYTCGAGGTATSGYAKLLGGPGVGESYDGGCGGGGAGYYGGYGGGLAPRSGGLPGGAGSNYIINVVTVGIPAIVDTPGMGYSDILITKAGGTIKSKQNGIWKDSKNIYAKQSGAWKDSTSMYAKQNGVWKESK